MMAGAATVDGGRAVTSRALAPARLRPPPRRNPILPALLVAAAMVLATTPPGAFGLGLLSSSSFSSSSSSVVRRYPLPPPSSESRFAPASYSSPLRFSSLSSSLHASSDEDDASSSSSPSASTPPRPLLEVGIVGAGPSGLLLAHRLLSSPSYAASVTIFESRPDPRANTDAAALEGRAYALGLNGRSRAAMRSVPNNNDGGGDRLWHEVKERGYESDKFVLRIGTKLKLKLRDGAPKLPRGFRDDDDDEPPIEPTVLIYQSDLCAALLDDLERKYAGGDGSKLTLRFGEKVNGVDVDSNYVRAAPAADGDDDGDGGLFGPFDLLAGCGGVNSPVRTAIQCSAPPGTFECETRLLPGSFKAVRLNNAPPGLDRDAVTLLIPGGGKKEKKKKKGGKEKGYSTTAFVEPVRDGGACILFAGGRRSKGGDSSGVEVEEDDDVNTIDPILAPPHPVHRGDRGSLALDLTERFPLMFDTMSRDDLDATVTQLLSQGPSRASSVRCNAYHYRCSALLGDAAHATGGVSGQGVNSAFVDAQVLGDCLDEAFADGSSSPFFFADIAAGVNIRPALLAYSQRQVPEGQALYDLSFGAEGELSVLRKLRSLLANARDTIFGGKFGIGRPVLQVQLSSTLRSFSDIRRVRNKYNGEKFPDQDEWAKKISEIYPSSTADS
eukprot:CAMPEP_0113574358 /NCGR_PEP_ID=MMETSP0015_2-20120614/27105_1 /TAXON_ID=2838 /ORGANISM="Odontella" /LENGTH=667 /DNA_ID=CAMNT_0000477491 /DNA_START=9 /DNA_END=2012 /DNA_ORIENTATION=- /assembly_acc=CAM_ASM_000160